MTKQTFNVIVSGEVDPECDIENVTASFSKLFNISGEQAASIIGTRRIIKTNIAYNDAQYYQENIAATGVHVVIETATTSANDSVVTESSKKMVKNPATAPLSNQTLPKPNAIRQSVVAAPEPGLVLPSANDAGAPAGLQMACFKCNHIQPREPQCAKCGVFIKTKEVQEHPPQPTGNARTTATAENAVSETSNDDIDEDVEEEVFSMSLLPMPVAAAIGGALLWKFIALTVGYEYGIVAWAIGGAVGFAAALAGTRGIKAGIVCGALLTLSIFGGKYLAYSELPDSDYEALMAALPQEARNETMNALQADHEEFLIDAAMFSTIPRDDNSIKSFMISRGYTEAESHGDVTEEDVQWFREEWEDELARLHREKPDFDEWLAEDSSTESAAYSPLTAVMENLGPTDGLFLMLGIGTAFRLGRGKAENEEDDANADHKT